MKKIFKILIIAFVAVFLIVFIRGCQGYRQMSPYLSSEMFVMPKLEYNDNDIRSMEEKYLLLSHPENNRGEIVLLSSLDLNLILKEKAGLESRIHCSLDDDHIGLLYSLPIPFFGKFFNGSMLFNLGVTDGTIDIDIQEVSANNISLDNDSIDLLEQTIAKYSQTQEKVARYLVYIDRVGLEKGNIVVKIAE